jgi:predicted enzyme related to lactoylglutathione lyase
MTLRTHDTGDARSFYADVLGNGERDIVQLHEQAVARGARPHWLGFLRVEDVDEATAAFLKRGATALGPKWVNAEGLEASVLRESGGAVLALAKRRDGGRELPSPEDTPVAWYQLNTIDVDRAKEDYRALFGWSFGDPIDLGEHGIFHPFAWEPGGAHVGWMTDIFGRAGWHPHWLFHFRVAALEPAMEAVRRHGGYVVGAYTLDRGARIAVCDDSQSAAFALSESLRASSPRHAAS